MKRLLYIYRYGILGGVVTQLSNRFQFLRGKAKMHVAFLQDYGGGSAFEEAVEVQVLGTGKARREYLKDHRFDVVTVIDTPEVYPDIRASKFDGCLIHETHTTTKNLDQLLELRAAPPMDAILTPSAYLQRRILGEFGFEGVRPVRVVPNCLDTAVFRPVEVEVPVERPIILWVGKLDDHKNWRGFLMLCQELARRRDDCEFWLVGGETANEQVSSAMFSTLCELGLLSSLRWIPRVEYELMPRLYSLVAASGGCLVSTSIDESFGMTVCEALACGCPVAAASVGALTEILEGALADALYPHGDLDAATRVVTRHLGDEDARRAFLAEGRKRVERLYGIESVGSGYLDLLRGLSDGR